MQRAFVAVAAGIALADASIVTLGLPSVRIALHTTVDGVALVLGVYVAVLALALLGAASIARAIGAPRLAAAGMALFCAASLACGASNSLELLLVMRGIQAVGAAGALVGAFDLLDAGGPGPGRRLWVAASVFGIAVGPALGGALTQAFDWRAIFLAQAPIALPGMLAALTLARRARRSERGQPDPSGPEVAPSPLPFRLVVALMLLSAALTAVIFLVVLLLVAGWSVRPLLAALAVTVLPASGAIAYRIVKGSAEARATVGCLLVAGGIGCLPLLPSASAWWTVAPQMLAGSGMGIALPALAGQLLGERTRTDAARLLSLRSAGIALALALLAPIASASFDSSVASAREQGTAALLDARLAPVQKLGLAPTLFAGTNSADPRGQLQRSIAEARGAASGADVAELDRLGERLDGVVTAAVRSAFQTAFIITAGLALAAGLVLLAGGPGLDDVRRGAVTIAVAASVLAVAAYGALYAGSEHETVPIGNPCTARALPDTGGLGGALQDVSLQALDRAACQLRSSREELLLALFNDEDRKNFEQRHGVDPRSLTTLGPALLGL